MFLEVTMKQSNDWISFSQTMNDVKPMTQDKVINKHNSLEQQKKLKRLNAIKAESQDDNTLTTEFVEPIDPYDYLSFKRDGVQEGVYRKLRLGKYPIDAQLNLHRLTLSEARIEVFQFIKDCYQHNVRTLLIIHGIGQHSKPYPALLKSHINHWLPTLNTVLAMHTAQKHHGGYGATYVLIRKSADKKRENRERHSKRFV